MSANDIQVGGDHYKTMRVQPWDALAAWLTPDQYAGYMIGTAIAYLARFNACGPGKGGVQDIEKAAHVLRKYVEHAGSAP